MLKRAAHKPLKLVPATKSKADCRLVMDWRNDPQTLAMFYHSDRKYWDSFFKEYKKDYFRNERLSPRFAVYKNKKIGFLRFSPYKEIKGLKTAVELDVNLNPSWRGKGLGARTIQEAKERVFAQGYQAAIAEVKVQNKVSILAFRKAGFQLLDRRVKWIRDINKKFKIIRLVCYRHEKK